MQNSDFFSHNSDFNLRSLTLKSELKKLSHVQNSDFLLRILTLKSELKKKNSRMQNSEIKVRILILILFSEFWL